MSVIEIKQHDITDCGAACLASISAYYGLSMPIARIRQMASTDRKGTNVLGLITAAEKLGFMTKAVKSLRQDGTPNLEPLGKIPLPAIAHTIVDGRLQHYVVIYKFTDKWVQIMDPSSGKLEKWSLAKLEERWTGILVILLPDEETFRKEDKKVSITSRLLYLLKPHKRVIIQSIFGSLVYTILGLGTSIFVQKIVDFVLPNHNNNLLNLMGVVMVIILALSLFINYCKSIFMLKIGQKIDIRLILGYYKHMIRLPQSFFDNMRTGELISRIGDAMKVRSFISGTLLSLITGVFTILFAFALMFTYYWKLALIILLAIPLYATIYWIYNKANKKTQRRIMEEAANLESHLVESINVVRTIKSFGVEEFANIKTETKFVALLNTAYRSGVNALSAGTASMVISQLFTIVLLWAGSVFVLDYEITPGELLSFYALIGYFIGPIGGLIGMNLEFQDAKIASDRLFEIMDLEVEDEEQKISIGDEHVGDISFENVSFSYGTRAKIFESLDLQIKKGSITAIVGESGSGKSTLASLLQNLYPLTEGRIKIGEIDIKHIENSILRNIIGVVPQKVDLIEGSILENIALGDSTPNVQRIVDVCSSIGMLDFIQNLPNDFATNVGENGVKLSGGQRQRLAIARVLYRNPKVVVMDEATSALDSKSEQYVKDAIVRMKQEGRTILIITHRLGTITDADKIVVLDDGKVVAEGVHSNLMENSEVYKRLFHLQMTGSI